MPDVDERLLLRLWDCGLVKGELPVDPERARMAVVQHEGMALQLCLEEHHAAKAEKIAGRLERFAGLAEIATDQQDPSDLEEWIAAPLDRIAAVYHLWPYHAAVYYGYLKKSPTHRVPARARLCTTRALLFANVRGVLDFLRASFGVDRYEQLAG